MITDTCTCVHVCDPLGPFCDLVLYNPSLVPKPPSSFSSLAVWKIREGLVLKFYLISHVKGRKIERLEMNVGILHGAWNIKKSKDTGRLSHTPSVEHVDG